MNLKLNLRNTYVGSRTISDKRMGQKHRSFLEAPNHNFAFFLYHDLSIKSSEIKVLSIRDLGLLTKFQAILKKIIFN